MPTRCIVLRKNSMTTKERKIQRALGLNPEEPFCKEGTFLCFHWGYNKRLKFAWVNFGTIALLYVIGCLVKFIWKPT